MKSDEAAANLLLTRLEHISADSYWAHRASGIRRSLVRILESLEQNIPVQDSVLRPLLEQGFFVLEQAAREKMQ
ncbi:MAG: hypothetical protein ONB11_07310 [candidate division KSB1 bacterium]|nr:hypothetical protein [candidate division KSB1 bacterium]